MTCTFCGKPVDTRIDYRKVTGWERGRSAGGTNAIAMRQVHEEWACWACVRKAKRGISPEQEAMSLA